MLPDLAERGTRLLAATIDELILFATLLPMVFGAVPAVVDMLAKAQSSSADTLELYSLDPQVVESALLGGPGTIISVLALIAWCVITAWLVATRSQSIGKRLVGIKVVRTDGSRASFARIFLLRNVVNSLPMLLPWGWLYQLIDPLLIYQPARQCVHDKIADTTVVRVR